MREESASRLHQDVHVRVRLRDGLPRLAGIAHMMRHTCDGAGSLAGRSAYFCPEALPLFDAPGAGPRGGVANLLTCLDEEP